MKAEEMFKKLGYEKTYDGEYSIVYTKEYDDDTRFEIEFFKMITEKQFKCSIFHYDEDNDWGEETIRPLQIDMNEFKAIKKQIEELGWS